MGKDLLTCKTASCATWSWKAAGSRAEPTACAEPFHVKHLQAALKKKKLRDAGGWRVTAKGREFEPWSPGSPVKRFSRPPHSTTLPPLRLGQASSVFRVDLSRLRQIVDNVDRLPGTVSSTFGCEHPMITRRNAMFIWRRDRDSNPRYAFGAHTISNRAPSASSVISPFSRSWPPHVFHSP